MHNELLRKQLETTRSVTAAAARLVRVCSETKEPIRLTPLATAYGMGDFSVPSEFLDLVRQAR